MAFQHYFRLGWLGQLLVGFGLFSVSFLLQAQVLLGFIAAPILAWALAVTFELGKVLAIIWHRYMTASRLVYPTSTRAVSIIFRVGLLLLSLICSLLYLGGQLDRPGLDAVRANDLKAVDKQEKLQLEQLDKRYKQALAALRDGNSNTQEKLQIAQQAVVTDLEQRLLKEMNIVVKGQFKGPRYRELERRLANEKAILTRISKEATYTHQKLETEISTRFRDDRTEIIAAAGKQRQRINSSRYMEDDRVNDPRIVAFTNLSAVIIGHRISPVVFVFGFAVMLSLLLELGIVLAFDTATAVMAPALHAQHKEEVNFQVFSSRVKGERSRDDITNQASMDKIRKAGEAAIKAADKVAAL